jgi:hypothetical protein
MRRARFAVIPAILMLAQPALAMDCNWEGRIYRMLGWDPVEKQIFLENSFCKNGNATIRLTAFDPASGKVREAEASTLLWKGTMSLTQSMKKLFRAKESRLSELAPSNLKKLGFEFSVPYTEQGGGPGGDLWQLRFVLTQNGKRVWQSKKVATPSRNWEAKFYLAPVEGAHLVGVISHAGPDGVTQNQILVAPDQHGKPAGYPLEPIRKRVQGG